MDYSEQYKNAQALLDKLEDLIGPDLLYHREFELKRMERDFESDKEIKKNTLWTKEEEKFFIFLLRESKKHSLRLCEDEWKEITERVNKIFIKRRSVSAMKLKRYSLLKRFKEKNEYIDF